MSPTAGHTHVRSTAGGYVNFWTKRDFAGMAAFRAQEKKRLRRRKAMGASAAKSRAWRQKNSQKRDKGGKFVKVEER
jgi:hypothetical protein